ncbi:efflux RND transporter permease subunit [Paeniroseomonas aquatica]|uniref:Efflux RND transporter permease subunit n=1 Tax=Paeniroseomonas aquatica TaxID=373043 RepID=A0ABT8A3S8_9PROT|nr:efflux RND transporter permease subunit [Paeniroseomonas aquatica]MDN3564209.1 efflux RND transporter permease subunit [Paeniroseomonas aquatica]
MIDRRSVLLATAATAATVPAAPATPEAPLPADLTPTPEAIRNFGLRAVAAALRSVAEATLQALARVPGAADARQVRLPPGCSIEWGGQFETLREATARPTLVVPAAQALIFAILYVMFGSVRLAGLIFINLPFAATGGIIALFGIAVLNGVVLVSTIVEQRRQGRNALAAARDAAMLRLRPVLTTATAASLGFLRWRSRPAPAPRCSGRWRRW